MAVFVQDAGDVLIEEVHALIDKYVEYAECKEMERFAWELFSDTENGEVSLKDLVEMIILFCNRMIDDYDTDDDDWEYIHPWSIYDTCCHFAIALLIKGLLDGRWSFSGEILADGNYSIGPAEFLERFKQSDSEEDDFDVSKDIKKVLNGIWQFDHKMQSFITEPLYHCTETNALAVLTLVTVMQSSGMYSPYKLIAEQQIWPEGRSHDWLVEAIARNNHSIICYSFLEQASSQEQGEVGSAESHLDDAKTLKEAAVAITEIDYWLQQRLSCPYTAYMLITGRMEDKGFSTNGQTKGLSEGRSEKKESDDMMSAGAMQILERADAGDAQAQYMLARMYIEGENVYCNTDKAVKWILKAAESGSTEAQYLCGKFYGNGFARIHIDFYESTRWYAMAAESGHAEAQFNLGLAYDFGAGVQRDEEKAQEWFRKAAENGFAKAKAKLKDA